MFRNRLLWQLFPVYFLASGICLLVFALFISRQISISQERLLESQLLNQAKLIAGMLPEQIDLSSAGHINAICKETAERTGTQITVTTVRGKVLGDSHKDPASIQDIFTDSEMMTASRGQIETRISTSDPENFVMHLAMPVKRQNKSVGVIRISYPLNDGYYVHADLPGHTVRALIITAVILGIVSIAVTGRLFYRLRQLEKGAREYTAGNLDYRIDIPRASQLSRLAITMNSMAKQIDLKISEIVRQRSEHQAILSSMVEGVLALDTEQRVISLNQAGAKLLDIDPEKVHSKTLQEVVRNSELQNFVEQTLQKAPPVEGHISLRTQQQDLFIQAHGTALLDDKQQRIGALIVLNDITQLRKLESVRRDFVANVSHELKTPVTSIKGFVETLLDGAMTDPEDMKRFLKVIARQADRLNAIIEDLLTLSKIELEGGGSEIVPSEVNLRDILETAVQLNQIKAKDKQISVIIECQTEIIANVNGPLLEQAITNLIDNAIKYSDQGKEIRVRAEKTDNQLKIAVKDQGYGIATEHLDRIFERFYVTDKARSRKLGGTGLGLAIVKHIAQSHNGTVEVQSKLGSGSTFFIKIPE